MHGCVTKTSLDISPSPGALLHCWRIFEADPMRPMLLADTTPFVSAQHFLNAVGSSIVPFLAHADGEPAALAWLYDIAMLPPKMTPLSAFLAVYVLPEFRSHGVISACLAPFLAWAREQEIEHLWGEVRVDNVASRIALSMAGFTQTAILPSWKRYANIWQDMALYHLPLNMKD